MLIGSFLIFYLPYIVLGFRRCSSDCVKLHETSKQSHNENTNILVDINFSKYFGTILFVNFLVFNE